ncbi:MAG TPA: hypothetical protein VFZ21_33045 [Gemmatimonadaceae bacterium]|jgi:hypothetical protein|nr:hypothetical protein [Gemmatimonadaceae bacterium]
MSMPRRVLGVVIALALLAGVAALSRVPYPTHDGERALLRLSWRARGERIERCRRASPAELANVPAHMRQEVICEGARIAPYRLRVAVDGVGLADGVVPGSGVVGDRPIYLLREFDLQPGVHHVQVAFEKHVSQPDDNGDARDREAGRESQNGVVPPRLTLDTTLTVGTGSVVLVTYNSEQRRLELHGGR